MSAATIVVTPVNLITASVAAKVAPAELLLRVNMTKQHDVTTRRYDNDLFDRFT